MKSFLQKNKILIIIFTFLLFITAFSGAVVLFYGDQRDNKSPITADDNIRTGFAAQVNDITTTASSRCSIKGRAGNELSQPPRQEIKNNQPAKSGKAILGLISEFKGNGDQVASSSRSKAIKIKAISQPAIELKDENNITVTVNIFQTGYAVAIPVNSTVYNLMDNLKVNNKINFNAKYYSGLGYFIEEINGVKNNDRPGFYWIYYINNKQARVGISTYVLMAGDAINWRYEKNNF